MSDSLSIYLSNSDLSIFQSFLQQLISCDSHTATTRVQVLSHIILLRIPSAGSADYSVGACIILQAGDPASQAQDSPCAVRVRRTQLAQLSNPSQTSRVDFPWKHKSRNNLLILPQIPLSSLHKVPHTLAPVTLMHEQKDLSLGLTLFDDPRGDGSVYIGVPLELGPC